MKIFNLSLKELLKNKLYFSYFTLGLALMLAVICVLVNYSEQVFEGFFTQFKNGGTLPLEVKEIPRESKYCAELPIYAQGDGVTYNTTVSYGDNSVFLPSYHGGLCVISDGNGAMVRQFAFLTAFGSVNFNEGTAIISAELALQLGCRNGDVIDIAGSEYKIKFVAPLFMDPYSFIIFDSQTAADEIIILISNKEQLLDISKYLNSKNFNDKDGILVLCNGYRGLRAGMSVVIVVLAVVCALYIFIFIRMYLSRREEFVRILFRTGIRKTQLFGCIGTVFAFLCFVGNAIGYLICVLLDLLVEEWASDLLSMHVDDVNYILYFAMGLAACVVISAVSIPINILKMPSEKEVDNR